MTRTAQITLHIAGIVLGLGGLAILVLAMGLAGFALAWSSYRLEDLALVAAIFLYAIPMGIGLLCGANWAASSANAEAYQATTAQARRTMGAILMLPCLATALALGLGYLDYRFWIGTNVEGTLAVLLALLLGGVGVWLRTRADVQSVA